VSQRPPGKGSFATEVDELVELFPHEPAALTRKRHARPAELQERIDIHARLFERAWQLDRKDRRRT